MQRALRLDVGVRQRAFSLKLLAGEDEALLVRRDALLILDLLLDIRDARRGLDVQRDRPARQRPDEDLCGGGGGGGGGGREAEERE